MPRRARLDVPGSLYHVMARGIEGTRLFRTKGDRETFLACMEELGPLTGTRIPAWVLMDNHFHLLVVSGPRGLASFMRKLMTRYAVYFNRRHSRIGHLFQNRYKSVLCEEEPYFLELVRYIHLNPLKANAVKTLEELDGYPWCGHSVIMGRTTRSWQDRATVLRHFHENDKRALRRYRSFLAKDTSPDKDLQLSGGGLVRSLGGQPLAKDERIPFDDRILGGGEFVTRILDAKEQDPAPVDKNAIVARICSSHGLSSLQLLGGSRRRNIGEARAEIIDELVHRRGCSIKEVARLIGISSSGVANRLKRREAPGHDKDK